jgi:heat shock protein HslJ
MNAHRTLLLIACIAASGCGGAGEQADTAATPAGAALPPPAQLTLPYRAHGNEPFWGLELRADSMVFQTPEADPLAAPLPAADSIEGGRRYHATVNGAPLTAMVLNRPCADGMSGMPYPHTVVVQLSGADYRGCGGEPRDLLTGGEWVVEDIDSAGVVDDARATLNFGTDGRVAGSTSCNNFSAPYTLTGEGLSFGEGITTRRACVPALMDQEQKFLAALRSVNWFQVDTTGALVLSGDEGPRILARRQ